MKKMMITAATALMLAPAAHSQSAIDALQVAEPSFSGTARFMGMGGAFTALGGDLSAVGQNPAGIGIYRHSEIGATLGIDIMGTKTESPASSYSKSKTKAACNNFGYIGVANLNSTMQTFAWGASYNRVSQFDRVMHGYTPSNFNNQSLTNYIANFTTVAGFKDSELNFGEDYNPYINGSADWLSILAYNSYLINNQPNSTNSYNGLYNGNTVGDAMLDVHEKGYVDEYRFNFGGNIANTVYWGLGIGVTDLSYTRETTYSESMENASAMSGPAGGVVNNADAGYYLDNYKHLDGTGWNISFGLIFKPVNELRIGAAIHSPTYWSIDHNYQGSVDYSFDDANYAPGDNNPLSGNEQTDYAGFSWRLKSPWRFNVGVAGVIGNSAIISLDYERVAYNDMTIKNAVYDNYGYIGGYDDNEYMNQDIRNYTKGGNILRVGAEYRVTPQFSLRAGYNYETSNTKDEAADGNLEVVTSGTDPSYSFNKSTQNITFGMGYRVSNWSFDAAYVHGMRKSTLHAYTNYEGAMNSPKYDVTNNTNSIVLSVGFRF